MMSNDWTDGFGTLCDNEMPSSTDTAYDSWGDSWSSFESSWTTFDDSSSYDSGSWSGSGSWD